MRVKFTLTMEDLQVFMPDDSIQSIDLVEIDWEADCDQQEILELSHEWIASQNFLTRRMIGLQRVGESSLTIAPLEDPVNQA